MPWTDVKLLRGWPSLHVDRKWGQRVAAARTGLLRSVMLGYARPPLETAGTCSLDHLASHRAVPPQATAHGETGRWWHCSAAWLCAGARTQSPASLVGL